MQQLQATFPKWRNIGFSGRRTTAFNGELVNSIEQLFPGLVGNVYQVTSPRNKDYNCIAWAAGDSHRGWWPSRNNSTEYWPSGLTRARTQQAFVAAFESLGYLVCDNEEQEAGYEKIALFANVDGPTHASRQLPNGLWTSKLGTMEDIEHSLRNLEGTLYGTVVVIMRRNWPPPVP